MEKAFAGSSTVEQMAGLWKNLPFRHLELACSHGHKVPARGNRKLGRLSMGLLDGTEEPKTLFCCLDWDSLWPRVCQGPCAQATKLPGTTEIRLGEVHPGNP
ncbi:hypothetical protein VULLAG_LOCUS6965 [Vulpes lagopus]